MRKKDCLLFASIILLVHACFLDKKDKDVVVKVENEFRINMVEELGTVRQLYLEMETVEDEPCNNSTISLSAVAKPENVLVQINGINSPTDCNPGPAPARSTINVGALVVGNYPLTIVVGNTVENQGILKVAVERYEVEIFTTHGITMTNKTMFRIPDQIVWGYVAYQDEAAAATLRDEFLSEIETMTAPHQLNFAGYYGQFHLNNNGSVSLKYPPQEKYHRAFLYRYSGTDADLENIVGAHRNASNGVTSVEIFRGDGKNF